MSLRFRVYHHLEGDILKEQSLLRIEIVKLLHESKSSPLSSSDIHSAISEIDSSVTEQNVVTALHELQFYRVVFSELSDNQYWFVNSDTAEEYLCRKLM